MRHVSEYFMHNTFACAGRAHLRTTHAVRDNIAHNKIRVFNDNLLCMLIPGNLDPYIKRILIKHNKNKNLGILIKK